MTDAITVINLPAGPTAYFKLSSIQLGHQIAVSGRWTAGAVNPSQQALTRSFPHRDMLDLHRILVSAVRYHSLL